MKIKGHENKVNLKNEDNVRKEDSLKIKTHTAPPLRLSVVLVSSEEGFYDILIQYFHST